MVLAMALLLAAIFLEGIINSPQEARSCQYRGLLTALAEEISLYFFSLWLLNFLLPFRCRAPVFASLVIGDCVAAGVVILPQQYYLSEACHESFYYPGTMIFW